MRLQAQLMQQLSPEQRLGRTLQWSSELLAASRGAWMAGLRAEHGDAQTERLDAWVHAQHGGEVVPRFAAARARWMRRQTEPAQTKLA